MLLPTVADPDLRHALALALDAAARGAADPGELAATAARVPDDDPDAWVLEWMATAGAAWTEANAGARDRHLHAATYYAVALAAVERSSEPERHPDISRRQRTCWDHAVARMDPPGVRLALPYAGTTVPAWFFPAPGAAPGERRATVIVTDGGDGPASRAWQLGGAAAAARGCHWTTFEGPGQAAALVALLTAVVDALLARDDVDAGRLAVIGTGSAGGWVPRALAFEHRLAAAVADPGVVDVSARWRAALPAPLRDALRRGDRDAFARELHLASLFSPPAGERLRRLAALHDATAPFRLGDEVARITTPLLITDPVDEPFWPGQSRELFDRLPGPKRLVRVGPADRDDRVFDWLDHRWKSLSPGIDSDGPCPAPPHGR